jgi:uncharacterized protein YndB with AHSA1/START domain
MRATATTTVDLSPEQVWNVLADHEGMSGWAPGLTASLLRTGAGDRNGVGAVRSLALPGPAPTIVEEVVEFEREKRLAYRAQSGVPFRGYGGEVELRPAGAGTEISCTILAEERVPVVERLAISGVAKALLTLLVRAAKRSGGPASG